MCVNVPKYWNVVSFILMFIQFLYKAIRMTAYSGLFFDRKVYYLHKDKSDKNYKLSSKCQNQAKIYF